MPVKDEIPVPCITTYFHSGKGEARIMYMQNWDVLIDKEAIGILSVHAIMASMDTKQDEPIVTVQEFTFEHARDLCCCQTSCTIGMPSSTFIHDMNWFLVLTAPIDGAVKKVLPSSLQLHLQYHSHYSTLAGNPDKRSMYDGRKKEYYWMPMANDVYRTVKDCCECAQNKPLNKQRRLIQLFPASDPLEFVEIHTLGPLPKTLHGNQYVLVVTYSFLK